MKTLLLTTVLVLGCTKAPEPITPKPGAPTALETVQLSEHEALLFLRTDVAGENVSVMVSAIEGLTLSSSPEVYSGLAVKAGTKYPIVAQFTRGPGRGQLVITVHGTFNGATRSRVHTVAIGDGPLPVTGTIQVTNDGDTVKLIP